MPQPVIIYDEIFVTIAFQLIVPMPINQKEIRFWPICIQPFHANRFVQIMNMSWLVKVMKCLEDPRYPCLGPHLRLLRLVGVWHPNIKSKSSIIKLAMFYFTISFFMSQYIKCLLKFDTYSLKLILQYAPFHMGVVKTCFFQKDHKKWERLIRFISEEELHQISTNDQKRSAITRDYIIRSRKVTFFFWALAFFSNFSIFTEPYQKNQTSGNETSVYVYIFDGYTPFAREPPGYYYSMFIQTVLGHMMSACVVGWDMLVVSIMVFFAGQLRISRLYCKRVIDSRSSENTHRNIAECHRFYIGLIQYQKIFNDLISPVMFIYLVVICINLGVCITELAKIEDDLRSFVAGFVFIIACLIQLLLFYWHSNEVTVESELVRYSSFESEWVYAERSVQKEVALLAMSTRKSLVLTAGPFHEMSLNTFISILRSSYSFYTLLKETH